MSPAEEFVINVSLQQLGGLGHFAHTSGLFTQPRFSQDVGLFYTSLQPEEPEVVGSVSQFGYKCLPNVSM